MGLSQYSDITSLSNDEINVEMVKIEKEIFDLRFKKATRQNYQLHELKNKKRKLAQLKTFARTLLDRKNK